MRCVWSPRILPWKTEKADLVGKYTSCPVGIRAAPIITSKYDFDFHLTLSMLFTCFTSCWLQVPWVTTMICLLVCLVYVSFLQTKDPALGVSIWWRNGYRDGTKDFLDYFLGTYNTFGSLAGNVNGKENRSCRECTGILILQFVWLIVRETNFGSSSVMRLDSRWGGIGRGWSIIWLWVPHNGLGSTKLPYCHPIPLIILLNQTSS